VSEPAHQRDKVLANARRDHARVASRRSGADPSSLEYGDRASRLVAQDMQRRRQAGETSADDGAIDRQRPARKIRPERWHPRHPETFASVHMSCVHI